MQMTAPIVPEDAGRKRLRPGAHIVRGVVLEALTEHRGLDVDADKVFAGDAVTGLLTRAATSPASLANAGWAGSLALQSVADWIVGLAPMSAGAALIERGLRVSLSGYGSVLIPARLMTASDAGGFLPEGAPFTVRQLNITGGATVTPHKFGTIVAFTREMMDRAVVDFEVIVRAMLSEACSLALDAAMFSSTAASSIRPAGILAGTAPIAATAGGGTTALAKDVENLIGAIAAVGGGSNVMLIASPAKVASLKAWVGPGFNYSIFSSAAVPAGQVIAIDPDLFVSGFDATPEFRSSVEAVMHFEDVAPLPISAAGTPPTVAAPSRSLFQTDCIAVRMTLRTGWALRAQGAAQHIASVTW